MKARATLSFLLQHTLNVALVLLFLLGSAPCKDDSSRDQAAPRPPASKPGALLPQARQASAGAPGLSTANQMLRAQGPVFIENRGQFDSRVKFLVEGNGANLWLTNDGIVFDFQRLAGKEQAPATEKASADQSPSPDHARFSHGMKPEPPPIERLVFKQKMIGASSNSTIEARDPQPGIYNYFPSSDPGTWRTHVLAYKEVVYREVWKGIDLKLFANGPNLEEEFIVHPGADASAVRLAYEGIEGLSVADDGSLKVATAFGDIVETSPRIYQEIAGNAVPLSGSFKVGAQNSYTFEVAKPDERADLIIDPTVIYSKPRVGRKAAQGSLLYSSFLGGSQYDIGNAIAVDNAGNAYITGQTNSTDFPTVGALQGSGTGVFITKVNALGSAPLVYSTYLGQAARGFGIAVDSSGSAYVVGGYTNPNFPTTANAYDQAPCGAFGEGGSAFFTKLSPAGDALVYSTCLGQGAAANAVAVDAAGNAYITGSAGQGFPVTASAYQSTPKTSFASAFFTEINPSASGTASLVYSSYLGGTPSDAFFGDNGLAIAVDAYGEAYIAGWTTSLDFPVTARAYMTVYPGQTCCNNCGCSPALGGVLLPSAFIAKFNPQASGAASLIYSTFLGGSLGTIGYGLAVDSLGNAYAAGSTGGYYGGIAEQPVPFPTTTGAYQTVPDNNDAFVTKFNAAGNNLVYSTLLGGSGGPGQQWSTGCALDASNDAYVTGWTSASNFPPAGNAYLPSDPNPAFQQGFVTQFNSTGTQLLYSSYLGGTMQATNGDGGGIAVDQVGDAYVTGSTYAIDFPITQFPFQPLYAGNGDAFVTKFPIGTSGGISITAILPNAGGNAGQVTAQIYGTGFHAGATAQLNCGGGPVVGQNVTVGANGQLLGATFNLTASSPGTCDVVVTNPDHTSARLAQGFTVQQGGAPNIQVSKTATLAIKEDNPPINVTYVIAVSNTGNIDLPELFLSEVLDTHDTLTSVNPPAVDDPASPPPAPTILWDASALGAKEAKTFTYSVVVAQNTPVGTQLEGRACQVPSSGLSDICSCLTTAAGDMCALAKAACTQAQTDCSPPNDPNSQLCQTEYCTCLNLSYQCAFLGETQVSTCVALGSSYRPLISDELLPKHRFFSAGGAQPHCGTYLEDLLQSASDPNYLAGPPGVGTQNWISGAWGLPYVVSFGNDPQAQTAAQQIVVTQPLDPSIDATTLSLVFVTVPNLSNPAILVTIPPGSFNPAAGIDEFMTNVDLRPVQSLFVTLDARLNTSTNTITWSFNSIDPLTGLPETNPLIGMLPPGANASVAWSAKPRQGLATGTQISEQASVVFNTNNPVNTNVWTNTVDNTPPVSQVLPLPSGELCQDFNVQWSGNDIGSGIGSYTIYVSDNGAPFAAWLTNTTSTSGTYNGQIGHTYGFYSIAQDLVGNMEPSKNQADTSTYVIKDTGCGPSGPPTTEGGRHLN